MTPSLARMIIPKISELKLPIKWFSIPQCWRYERSSLGRKREHYQWNCDIWGIKSVHAEVELINTMVFFFKRIGLTSKDVGIKIGNRFMINELLKQMNIQTENFSKICVILDRLDKVDNNNNKYYY